MNVLCIVLVLSDEFWKGSLFRAKLGIATGIEINSWQYYLFLIEIASIIKTIFQVIWTV